MTRGGLLSILGFGVFPACSGTDGGKAGLRFDLFLVKVVLLHIRYLSQFNQYKGHSLVSQHWGIFSHWRDSPHRLL